MGERRHSTGDVSETSAFKVNSICGLEEEWNMCHIYLSSKMTTVTYIRQLTRLYWGLSMKRIKQALCPGEFKINWGRWLYTQIIIIQGTQ